MPRPTQPRTSLTLLTFAFCIAAAILWLLPLFSAHSILFPSGPNFEDIVVYKGRFTLYHTLKFFTARGFSAFAYPPGAAPIYAAFYATANAIQTFLLLSAIAVLITITGTWLYLRRNGVAHLFALFLLAAFPIVFLIQRANIELVLWIIVAIGILAYIRGAAIVAAVLFGIAAAIKLYPIFLLGLFLRNKRETPAFLIGLITAVASLLAACAYTGPTLALAAHGFATGIGNFQNHYVDTVSRVEVIFDHSLFSPLKYLAFQHHTSPAPYTHAYYLTAGAFALLLFLRVRTLPFLNRLIFLVTAMVCLPPVSFNYTLVHLYLPILLLCVTLATLRTSPPASSLAALALLLFVMLPLMSVSIIAPGASPTQPFPSGPLQSCALLLTLILSALTPWPPLPGRSNL